MNYSIGAKYDEKTAKKLMAYLITSGVVFAGGEYVAYSHISEVPVTHRKQVVVCFMIMTVIINSCLIMKRNWRLENGLKKKKKKKKIY